MARWRLQSPNNFPPSFHAALHFELGKGQVIDRFHTKVAAKSAQERWNLFCFCMRALPSHKSYQAMRQYQRRTSVGYGGQVKGWELRVDVQESAESLLKNAQVIVKPLDS